jgi:hypothetical protein
MDIHYGHELRQLLVAATNWEACRGSGHKVPPHLENLAEDSVVLHGRNLYDLFVMPKGEDRRRALGLSLPLTSSLYDDDFITALHEKAMHVGPTRPYAPSGVPADDLPNQMLNVARDLLSLWDEVLSNTTVPQDFREAMQRARGRAITEAHREAAWYRIEDVFA